MEAIRNAPFALRIVHRKGGSAAIVYRRKAINGHDHLQRIAALSPLAFTAAASLLRDAIMYSLVAGNTPPPLPLQAGPFYPLNADWGARVACFALLAAGLRDGERLLRAADHLRHADPDEAAWWLGLLTRQDNLRALRAFRIITEAVE